MSEQLIEKAAMTAGRITQMAWREFDEWVASQSDAVQELSALEQVELYTMHLSQEEPKT